MQPSKYDLVVPCGASLDADTVQFTWLVGGAPVNLTGYSASMRGASAAGELFNWNTTNGKLMLGGSAGTITPAALPADTSALWSAGLPPAMPANGVPTVKAATWAVELTDANGKVTRLLQGDLLLIPEVL